MATPPSSSSFIHSTHHAPFTHPPPKVIVTVVTTTASYSSTSSSPTVPPTLAAAATNSLPNGPPTTISAATTVGPLVLTSWTVVSPSQTQNVSISNDNAAGSSHINVGAIAGGAAAGGCVFLAVVCGLLYFLYRRRKYGPNYPWGNQKDIFAPGSQICSFSSQ